MTSWKEFKYKNLTLVLIGLVAAFLITDYPTFQDLLLRLKDLKYFGAFLGGILFVSTFTFGIGTVILVSLAETSSPLTLAVFAGLGAVVGDLLIFRFVKDRLAEELRPLYQKMGKTRLGQIFYSQFFAWILPIIGAVIIASPLPDELGVSLMGISNISTYKFTLISFVLNTAGIFLILLGYRAVTV
jgi:hypothetical protein